MCCEACRVFKSSSNGDVLPSSWPHCFFRGSVFDLSSVFSSTHSGLTPLLPPLPFPPSSPSLSHSLPIARVGCLSVSETKQTESCVSGPITPRSSETGSSQSGAAVSSFAGHVRHSPDICRRLLGFFCALV